MRIAYLTQPYPPMISGAAIVAQQTANAMAQSGHQVLVIAASEREYPYDISEGSLTVLRLRSYANPLRVGQRLLASPLRATLRALSQFQPDVIHVHEPVQMGMLALEYAKHAQIPVVFTAHSLPCFVTSYLPESLRPVAEKLLWVYARWLLGKYASVITPTQTVANMIQGRTGIKPRVISNGLNLQTFHPPLASEDETAARQKWNLPLNVPLLLHTGRLDTDKSVDQVIRTAAQAFRESEAHLVIVGDGCQKNNLIKLCAELGIETRVHFLGFVSVEAGLPEIYRLANVFMTTSEIETQGLVLLEAAASALPIVAVNATCVPEIVHDRVNGFLAKSGDIQALGAAAITLLKNPREARRLGREGRILAEVHGLDNTRALHEELYQKTIKRMSRRGLAETSRPGISWRLMKTLIKLK